MKRLLVGLVWVLALCSCGNSRNTESQVQFAQDPLAGGEVARGDWSYSRSPDLGAQSLEAELHAFLVVPPDRALMRIEVEIEEESRTDAGQRLLAAVNSVSTTVSQQAHCEVNLIDYRPPTRTGREEWKAAATAALHVKLESAADAGGRLQLLEACLEQLAAVQQERVQLTVGPPLLTIDDPSSHRAEVLSRALQAHRDVAAVADAPPQYRPDDLRCTSTGEVQIVGRALSGVRLSTDVQCRTASGVAPAPNTVSAPAPAGPPAAVPS